MSAIQIFQNDRFGEVRVTEVNGQPYFIASDVAKALGYSIPQKAVLTHCKHCSKMEHPSNKGTQVNIIPESDVYRLVMRSKLSQAEAFQDWVVEEVLPAIRKTGSYTMALPRTYSEALRQLADVVETKEKIQLQLEVKTQQLDEAKDWFSIKRWAKEHGINWRKISWRALKAISAEHGLEVKKIFDGNYGEVNLYHRKAFVILYGK